MTFVETSGDVPREIIKDISDNLAGITSVYDFTVFLQVIEDELDCIRRLQDARDNVFKMFLAVFFAGCQLVFPWVWKKFFTGAGCECCTNIAEELRKGSHLANTNIMTNP